MKRRFFYNKDPERRKRIDLPFTHFSVLYRYFYPDELADNDHIPEIHITGLQVGNRRIYPGDSMGILRQSTLEQRAIMLTYRDDIITFLFAAMDFTAPEKNCFRYKLEGWDRS